MPAEPVHLPSADQSSDPDRARSSEDTINFETVQPDQSGTPPSNPPEPPSADYLPAAERASGSVGDTVDLPPEQADQPPDDQPVTHKVDPPEAEPKRRWGSLLSNDGARLLLRVEGAQKPLQVVVRERVVVGRAHPPTGFVPDVDLSPFNAHRKGVSREHLAITFRDHMLQVEDLRSMNGSLLNGWVLMPHEPRVLRDGDQLILGRLSLYVAVLRE